MRKKLTCAQLTVLLSFICDIVRMGPIMTSAYCIMSEQHFSKPKVFILQFAVFSLITTLFCERAYTQTSIPREIDNSQTPGLYELHWYFQSDWCLPRLCQVSVLASFVFAPFSIDLIPSYNAKRQDCTLERLVTFALRWAVLYATEYYAWVSLLC